MPARPGDLWLFAYGSLLWDRCFETAEARPALLRGYHRALCIYSHIYRGTPQRPGLVLGLDLGGACRGVAYRLGGARPRAELAAITRREMINGVYVPRRLKVLIVDDKTGVPAGAVMAHTFVARRGHRQYAGRLAPERVADLVLQGSGTKGTCRDYVESTLHRLQALAIRDGGLERPRSA